MKLVMPRIMRIIVVIVVILNDNANFCEKSTESFMNDVDTMNIIQSRII